LLTALARRVSSTPRRGVHISWSFLDILKLTKITLIKKTYQDGDESIYTFIAYIHLSYVRHSNV
jgi:hypothetical protein